MGRIKTFVHWRQDGTIELQENNVYVKTIKHSDLSTKDTTIGNFVLTLSSCPSKIWIDYNEHFWILPRCRICSVGDIINLDKFTAFESFALLFVHVIMITLVLIGWDDIISSLFSIIMCVGAWSLPIVWTVTGYKKLRCPLPDELKYS